MGTVIDLSRSVYEICRDEPGIIEIMKDLGFESIANPGMLNTAGRFMTIPKGAAMKKIPIEKIVEALKNKGYEVRL